MLHSRRMARRVAGLGLLLFFVLIAAAEYWLVTAIDGAVLTLPIGTHRQLDVNFWPPRLVNAGFMSIVFWLQDSATNSNIQLSVLYVPNWLTYGGVVVSRLVWSVLVALWGLSRKSMLE